MLSSPDIIYIQKYHQYFPSNFKESKTYKNNPEKYDLMMKVSSFYHCSNNTGYNKEGKYFNIIDYVSRKEANGDKASLDELIRKNNLLKYGDDKKDISTYMGDRPGSTGLFNSSGDIDTFKQKQLMKKLSEIKTDVFEGVLSFTPEFSMVNCNSKYQAYELMCKIMPDYFRFAGLDPNNVEWFCAYHTNTDNRHIHITFFEKEPSRFDKYGRISNPKFNKKSLSYLKSLVALNTKQINHEYEKLRDPVLKNIEDYISTHYHDKEISSLRDMIIKSNTKQYSRLKKEEKVEIDNFKNTLFEKCPDFKASYQKHEEALKYTQNEIMDILKANNIKSDSINDNALNFFKNRTSEMDRRIKNRIIKAILNENKYPKKAKTFIGQLKQNKVYSSVKRRKINNQLNTDTERIIKKRDKFISNLPNIANDDAIAESSRLSSAVWKEVEKEKEEENRNIDEEFNER